MTQRFPFLSLLAVTLATPAFASGGEDGEHHAHVANWFDPMGEANHHAPALFWVMVTFAVFLFMLYRFAWPGLKQYIKVRHDDVKNAIEEAKQAREEAEAKKREYETRLKALDDEIAALKKDFEDRGKAEMARLEEAGRAAAERIKKDAEDTISAESERAQETLRKEASKLALELAEERIIKAVSSADEKRLQDDFLNQLAQ
jgi:F-type H+-transporting ATPase subunit b